MDDFIFSRQDSLTVDPDVFAFRWIVRIKTPEKIPAAHERGVDGVNIIHALKFCRLFVPDVRKIALIRLDGLALYRVVRPAKENALPSRFINELKRAHLYLPKR